MNAKPSRQAGLRPVCPLIAIRQGKVLQTQWAFKCLQVNLLNGIWSIGFSVTRQGFIWPDKMKLIFLNLSLYYADELQLNVAKTKELVLDFRKHATSLNPMVIKGSAIRPPV